MPAAAPVEELLPTWSERRKDVLEIGRRRGHRAESCRTKRPAPRCDEHNGGKPACDLESPAGDVLVWDSITREVQGRPEQERPTSRAQNGAGGGAGCDVQRDDHRCLLEGFHVVAALVGVGVWSEFDLLGHVRDANST
jgi:hypothetical protein